MGRHIYIWVKLLSRTCVTCLFLIHSVYMGMSVVEEHAAIHLCYPSLVF